MLKCFVNRTWRERYLGFLLPLFDASSVRVTTHRGGFRGGKCWGSEHRGCSSWFCLLLGVELGGSLHRAPGERGCCNGNAAAAASCFSPKKGEYLAVLTARPPRKHRFAQGVAHPRCILGPEALEHPPEAKPPVPPANLLQVPGSANWIVSKLHISLTLHHFLAAFSRLIQQMFSILPQDSNMRWAQNLAVIYLQLKFMTYTNIYIHLKWKAELRKHFSSIFLLYVLVLPSVEIIICLVI